MELILQLFQLVEQIQELGLSRSPRQLFRRQLLEQIGKAQLLLLLEQGHGLLLELWLEHSRELGKGLPLVLWLEDSRELGRGLPFVLWLEHSRELELMLE